MVRATVTRLIATERSFNLVFESHQFSLFISFRCIVIGTNRWMKSFEQGSTAGPRDNGLEGTGYF